MITKTMIANVHPGLEFKLHGKWYLRLRDLANRSAYPNPIRALDQEKSVVRDLSCNLIVEVMW